MVAIGLLAGAPLAAASLTPTHAAFDRQVVGAEAQGYARASTTEDVYEAVRNGALVQLTGNDDYELKATIPLPFARPELGLFVERLAAGYQAACGDRLVVTSLVRPKNRQPRNAHPRSVHQLGLAADLRVSWKRSCRGWLEANLLHLESEGVIEASRERYPPHYHVVVFTDPYLERVESADAEAPRLAVARDPVRDEVGYVVQEGDSLWRIANRFRVDVGELRAANGLRGTTIRPGQLLQLPSSANGVATAEATGAAATYRVRSGDTLWRIARRYGTSPQSLQRANGLRSSRIMPGQVLTVPVAPATAVRGSR
jgi:LysM repeat protein